MRYAIPYCINIGWKDYLLVLDNVVSAGVASSAVASEYLGTVLKVGGEGSRGDWHHTNNDSGSKLIISAGNKVKLSSELMYWTIIVQEQICSKLAANNGPVLKKRRLQLLWSIPCCPCSFGPELSASCEERQVRRQQRKPVRDGNME